MALQQYYTTSDLTKSFGVTSRTLNRWSNPHATPFCKPMPKPIRVVRGSDNRYSPTEIDDWVKTTYEKTSHLAA